MSIVVVAIIVWLVVLVLVVALMASAKRADDQARRQHRRFVRSARPGVRPKPVRDGDRERERSTHRRVG